MPDRPARALSRPYARAAQRPYASAAFRATTLARSCRGHGVRLELEVEAQCFVELSHQVGGNSADHWAQPFDGHGPDLFGLRL